MASKERVRTAQETSRASESYKGRDALHIVYVSSEIDEKYRGEINTLLGDENVCSKTIESEVGTIMLALDSVVDRTKRGEHLYELEYTVNIINEGLSTMLGFMSVGPISTNTWPYLKEFYGRNGIKDGDRLVELINFYPFGNLYGDNRPHADDGEYRHKHVGEAILERVIEDYRSVGIAAIVGVNMDVPSMQGLLRKVGFENVRQPIYSDEAHTKVKWYTEYFVMMLKGSEST
jgi:hypothetical protein